VLGRSPSWQDADGACSGYLVEDGGSCLLVDCGSGVFSKLRRFRDYVDVDAVVITHMHADHFLDLIPFASALTYAPRQQPVPVERWPGTDGFIFGADHGPTDALEGFADDSDLLILEATLPRPEREGPRGHLTAGEAGEHAARCNPGRLVLTHISDELDGDWALAEAQRSFDGPVEVAREGAVYEV